jgi:hypothetical protein
MMQDSLGSRPGRHRRTPEASHKHDGRWAKRSDAMSDKEQEQERGTRMSSVDAEDEGRTSSWI